MANQFIQVPPQSTGLKLQTFENTVGVNIVESEAVTLVRALDNTEIGTLTQPVRIDPTGTTTQPISGTATVIQALGSNLHVIVDAAPVTAVTLPAGVAVELLDSSGVNKATISVGGALKVDGSAVTQPVSGTFWQATQPVSGTVTSNAGTNLNTSALALETGGNLATVVTNTTGVAKDSSLTTLDTDLKATQPRDITDRTARLLGHVNVDNFPATQPVSAVSLPLPANAAQEVGGNLAAITTSVSSVATQTRNDAQIVDLLMMVVSQLKLLNINLASSMPGTYVDSDTTLIDTFPTN